MTPERTQRRCGEARGLRPCVPTRRERAPTRLSRVDPHRRLVHSSARVRRPPRTVGVPSRDARASPPLRRAPRSCSARRPSSRRLRATPFARPTRDALLFSFFIRPIVRWPHNPLRFWSHPSRRRAAPGLSFPSPPPPRCSRFFEFCRAFRSPVVAVAPSLARSPILADSAPSAPFPPLSAIDPHLLSAPPRHLITPLPLARLFVATRTLR